MNLGDWLRELGCTQYELLFVENAIDIDVLSELTESDLENLKIPLGDRKRLLRGIKSLADPQIAGPDTGAGRLAQSERPDVAHAERRHLTVMICDLVGSTALSARLDPEDMRAVMDAYHAACARITSQYDGFLAEFRGDGILAYFGYPSAHEDDAERTVRAGLDIIAAVAGLKTRANESLAVRIGIATGLVVVGAIDSKGALRQHAVVGDTPNLAARVQALAEPGMVIVAASTRQLIGDLFRLRTLGDHQVKGISEPVAAWVVEGTADSKSRFEAIRTVRLADFIGRDDEIKFLNDRQGRAWNGKGQIVLISGEPGVGKSRISAALADRIAAEPHTRLSYQCSPYHTNSALHPFIVQLEHAARFGPNDTPDEKLEKLEAMLAMATSRVQSVAPLFANLLSIPFGDRYPASELSPTQQRRQTLAALLDQFEGLARREPILLLFEDAHWADATSLQLLDLAIERIRQLPVLALFTARPEFEFPWGELPHVSTLTLGPLDRPDVEKMILRVARGRSLPTEVTNQIIAKTDGNPLFVEELTKAVLEGGLVVEKPEGYRLSGFHSSLEIPATLHDSLMARLDRLAPVKEICQIGAAIGREFSYELLHAVVGRDERSLSYGLAQLEEAELLFRRGAPPEATYSFKHALVQDAAYESLLKSRRQELHGQIARALEEKCAEIVASQPEIVAHHLTRAGLADPAVSYWLKAGNLALSRSANVEAVKHLKQGIELTQSIPASPTRLRKELDLYLALAPALAATEGYVTPETLKAFSHARDLMGDNGSLTEQITVLWGAYLAHGMRAEHVEALAVAQECLKVGAHHEHAGMLAMGNRFAGQALTFMGAFADARHHLEQALVLCTTNNERVATYRKFGVDDQVTALSFLATNLLLLGYLEQAAAAVEDAVSRARAINLPFTTAMTLSHVAFLGTLGCDLEKSLAYADEAIAHTAEQGRAGLESTAIAAHQAHRARFIQGALLAQRGDPEHGIVIMSDAVASAEHTGVRTRRTLYLGHLASAHASLGRPVIGLNLIEEAIKDAEVTHERFFEAELYRLRGTILKALGNTHEAEAGFRRALTIAREQQAHWWELRASNDLAMLLHEDGKGLEAYCLLQSSYSWFKEGLDRPDLRRAKALLDELSHVFDANTNHIRNRRQHNLVPASGAPIGGDPAGNA
jgi:class 3 adenylate cyclase/tetratricopeptide (TPR) repeat protein/ABC-type transport system involved in cytochrome c biogenesis ATPase subunit